jgi:tryptophan synthase beta chain
MLNLKGVEKVEKYYGEFGGMFVPEMMVKPLKRIDEEFEKIKKDKKFKKELNYLLKEFVGRPSRLTYAKNMSSEIGCKIYLKREDLLHSGAHKINNTLGQALLAKKLGAKEIIAETGAGQHGVATAIAGTIVGLPVKVFMGSVDIKRQEMNVYRMKLFGAEVIPAESGSKTLKDAVNEALRYYLANSEKSYYLIGSVVGPAPYPKIVRHFQKIISKEMKRQILAKEKRLPTHIIACVGGGSNAIGAFNSFIDTKTKLVGVEPAGDNKKHGLTLTKGSKGVFQGAKSYVLQDENGQIHEAHSISAGLDYPGVGPIHSYLKESKKAKYVGITDNEAVNALSYLCKKEGILPALESAHAVAYVLKNKKEFKKNDLVIINLSGRGDKDVEQLIEGGYNV